MSVRDDAPGRAVSALPRRVLPILSAVLALGAILRVAAYASRQSLSIDESLLGLNLIGKSAVEIAGRLDFNQAAPIGFLVISDAITSLFGFDEAALRALPLVASLLSLPLFWLAARRFLCLRAALFALAWFSVLDPLIYYAAIGKPYAIDVVIALALWAVVLRFRTEVPTIKWSLAIFALGSVSIFLSFPSIFILATGVLVALTTSVMRRSWRTMTSWIFIGTTWAVLAFVHLLSTRSNIERIQESFEGTGATGNLVTSGSRGARLSNVEYIVGLKDTSSGESLFSGSFGASLTAVLTVLTVCLGAIGVVHVMLRDRPATVLLVGPVLFAGLAAAFGIYPLVGRTLLFAVPVSCMFIGAGVVALAGALSRRAAVLAYAGCVAMLSCLVGVAVYRVAVPRANQGMREVVALLEEKRRHSDGLFVSPDAAYTLAYYLTCNCVQSSLSRQWDFRSGRGGTAEGSRPLESGSPALVIARDDRDLGQQLSGVHASRYWILVAEASEPTRRRLLRDAQRDGTVVGHWLGSGPPASRAELFLVKRSTSARGAG